MSDSKRWFEKAKDYLSDFNERVKRGDIPSLPKSFGAITIVVVSVAVISLNLWAFADETENNTVSAWMTTFWKWSAAFPFFAGGVIGHWCSRDFKLPAVLSEPMVFFLATVSLLLIDVFFDSILGRQLSVIWVVIGFLFGFFFWQMFKVAT